MNAEVSHWMFHTHKMVILTKPILTNFSHKHADTTDVLNEWYKITKDADWKDFNTLKEYFPSTNYVGNDRYVFNIKGNSYRLIAMMFFDIRTVFIRFIGTYAEYSKIKNASTV